MVTVIRLPGGMMDVADLGINAPPDSRSTRTRGRHVVVQLENAAAGDFAINMTFLATVSLATFIFLAVLVWFNFQMFHIRAYIWHDLGRSRCGFLKRNFTILKGQFPPPVKGFEISPDGRLQILAKLMPQDRKAALKILSRGNAARANAIKRFALERSSPDSLGAKTASIN